MTTTAEIVRLEIPAQPAFVGVARTVVVAVAGSVPGIDDDRLEDLRIAVSEACTNAVEQHGADGAGARVVVRCVVDGERLAISLEDSGDGLAPETMAEAAADQPAGGEEPGWGLTLIEALVDEVRFERRGSRTAIHLIMRRGAVPDDESVADGG